MTKKKKKSDETKPSIKKEKKKEKSDGALYHIFGISNVHMRFAKETDR